MSRLLVGLLLLASLAGGQGAAPLRVEGTSLESFRVVADAKALARDTPRGLAEAYARYVTTRHAARLKLGRLFLQAHLAVLERYCSRQLVQKQRAAYGTVPGPAVLRCSVAGVEAGVATLRSVWTDPRDKQTRRSTMRLVVERRQGGWWIARILHLGERGKFVERGLGIPPAQAETTVPEARQADLATPAAAVASLRDDMLRLRAMARRAEASLHRGSAVLCGGFFGRKVVQEAQRSRPAPAPGARPRFEILDPPAQVAGVVRVGVLATEEVPGAKGKRSAIGQAVFDLQRDGDQWRVTSEHGRPDPSQPLVIVEKGFALFFLG